MATENCASLRFIGEKLAHSGDINQLKFGRDGKVFSCSGDKKIKVWNCAIQTSQSANRLVIEEHTAVSPLIGHKLYVNTICVSNDASMLISGSTDGQIIVWSLPIASCSAENARIIQTLCHNDRKSGIRCCNLNANGDLLASGSDDGRICVWNCRDQTEKSEQNGAAVAPHWILIQSINLLDDYVSFLEFSVDSRHLITAHNGQGYLYAFDWSLAAPSTDHNEEAPQITKLSDAHDMGIKCGAMTLQMRPSPHIDNNNSSNSSSQNKVEYQLATGGGDNLVKIWRIGLPKIAARTASRESSISIEPIKTLRGHSSTVTNVSFRKCGIILASVSMDHFIVIWSLTSFSQVFRIEVEKRYLSACCFSCDGAWLAAGGNDRMIRVYEFNQRESSSPPPPSLNPHNCDENQQQSDDQENDENSRSKIAAQLREFRKSLPSILTQLEEIRPSLNSICEWSCSQLANHVSFQINLPEYHRPIMQQRWTGQTLLTLNRDSLAAIINNKHLAEFEALIELARIASHQDYISAATEWRDDEFLVAFLCPISQEIMLDPVIAQDGHSYNRNSIEAWFTQCEQNCADNSATLLTGRSATTTTPAGGGAAGGGSAGAKSIKCAYTSPLTNLALPNNQLIDNRALRRAILAYIRANYKKKRA